MKKKFVYLICNVLSWIFTKIGIQHFFGIQITEKEGFYIIGANSDSYVKNDVLYDVTEWCYHNAEKAHD